MQDFQEQLGGGGKQKLYSVLQAELLLMLVVDLEIQQTFLPCGPVWGQDVQLLTLDNI